MSYIGNEPVVFVELDKLTDVVITSPATDQVLKYNGTNWVNGTDGGGGSATIPASLNIVLLQNYGGFI
jgi:hypothetical protein